MTKRKTFYADIASGLRGCNFTLSPCVASIRYNNRHNKIKFAFWAFASNGEFGREWIREAEYKQAADKVWRLVLKPGGLDFFAVRLKKSLKEREKFRAYVWQLLPRLKNLDQAQLIKAYDEFIGKYNYYFGLGVMTFVYESDLSERFLRLLIKNGRPVSDLNAILKNDYRSFMLESETELAAIKKAGPGERRERLIAKYLADFFFIQSDYHSAPVIDRAYVLAKIRQARPDEPAPRKAGLRLDREEKTIARLLQLTEGLHDCRKKTNQVGLYGLFRFLEEASRRHHQSLKTCRRAFWFEYGDLLTRPEKMIKILRRRSRASLIFADGREYYLGYPALKERRALSAADNLRGVPASAGFKRGRARLIFSRDDFGKIKAGEILVTTMTRPEFLPAIKKAGAVVTEEGGVTSHAAIVARELKIPCIVGLKNLTRIVKDGQLLAVDADQGTLKIIKK